MEPVIKDEEGKANIKANLTRIMETRGISQAALASMTEIPQMTINRTVRGIHVPSSVYLARIAEALDVSMERLIGPPPTAFMGAPVGSSQENFKMPLDKV
jgi:transcriptional regulator with XRE-family HTH domain